MIQRNTMIYILRMLEVWLLMILENSLVKLDIIIGTQAGSLRCVSKLHSKYMPL
jgi:hypothetical protein